MERHGCAVIRSALLCSSRCFSICGGRCHVAGVRRRHWAAYCWSDSRCRGCATQICHRCCLGASEQPAAKVESGSTKGNAHTSGQRVSTRGAGPTARATECLSKQREQTGATQRTWLALLCLLIFLLPGPEMGITVRGSEERVVADLTRGFFVEPIAELGLGVQKTRSDPLDGAERGPPDVDMAAEDRAICQ